MGRQEKIDRIYEEIADKTLSFGCKTNISGMRVVYNSKLFHEGCQDATRQALLLGDYNMDGLLDVSREEIKPIGHPVMIGDVLDWCTKEKKMFHFDLYYDNTATQKATFMDILEERKELRKPIQDQPIDCIDFVYSLLPND